MPKKSFEKAFRATLITYRLKKIKACLLFDFLSSLGVKLRWLRDNHLFLILSTLESIYLKLQPE